MTMKLKLSFQLTVFFVLLFAEFSFAAVSDLGTDYRVGGNMLYGYKCLYAVGGGNISGNSQIVRIELDNNGFPTGKKQSVGTINPQGPVGASCSAISGKWLYVAGDGIKGKTIRFEIAANGSLTNRTELIDESMPQFHTASMVASGKYLIVMGGWQTRQVYAAEIKENGDLGSWEIQRPLPTISFSSGRAFKIANRIYISGNPTYKGRTDRVYSCETDETGLPLKWRRFAELPEDSPEYSFCAMPDGQSVFYLSGETGFAYEAPVIEDGEFGEWRKLPLNLLRPGLISSLGTPLAGGAYLRFNALQDEPRKFLPADILEPWDAAVERAAVTFDAPNGPACSKPNRIYNGIIQTNHFLTGRPEYTMPVGAGDLSAMVNFGDNTLEIHLSKTDYLATADGITSRTNDIRGLELRSPGHVSVTFTNLSTDLIKSFAQTMDLKHGRLTVDIGTDQGPIFAEIFGDRPSGALVVNVDDHRENVTAPHVTITRKMASLDVVGPSGSLIPSTNANQCITSSNLTTGKFKLAIGAASDAAKAAYDMPAEKQTVIHDNWWREYWRQGWISLEGNSKVEKLEKLWYVNLYAYANVGYGKMPPKFNGGPGIVYDDVRCWGKNVWWQNTREMIWPMAPANHAEFAKRYLEYFGNAHANFAGGYNFKTPPANGIMRLAETSRLYQSPIFTDLNCPVRPYDAPYTEPTDEERAAARAARIKQPGAHTSHVQSSGTEVLMQMVDYVRFTGDKSMLKHIATWLRSQTELYLMLTEKGDDGYYHIRCTNVNESWIKVDDGIVDLASARWLFAQTAAHGAELGFPANFIEAAKLRMDKMAPYPRGKIYTNYHDKPNGLRFKEADPTEVYHPCIISNGMLKANFENNELYLIHPYVMANADVDGPDRDRAIATYKNGPYTGGGAGWNPVGIAVARMKLTNALDVVFNHARNTCRWPYGGGGSPGARLYIGSPVEDTVYFDGTGVMQTGIQELLIQSHAEEPCFSFTTGGPIRFLPCIPEDCSGAFKLRARGGFIITAFFTNGKLDTAEIYSEFGNDFTWISPETGKTESRKTKTGERFSLVYAKEPAM